MAYPTSYAPSTPISQGYQGQQGASQTPNPNVSNQTYRGTSWTPAPGSTGQNLADPYKPTTSQPKPPAAPTAGTHSPVTPTGGVNYNQTQRWSEPVGGAINSLTGGQASMSTTVMPGYAPQPPMATPMPPQPTTPDPFAAMGGGVWTGEGWVPRNHPLAQPYLNQPQPGAQPGGVQPNPALYSPYGPYPGRPDGTTYQPGQIPQAQFDPYSAFQFMQGGPSPHYAGQVDQFNQPQLGKLEGQQDQLLQLLMSGGSLDPVTVAQMKEAQKQGALAMQQQQGTLMNQSAAARGGLNSGATMAGLRNLGAQTQENILGGYRDIDIAAAMKNRQDQLAALQASEALASGRAGRAMDFYNTGLGGQLAQEGLNQTSWQNRMDSARFGADQQARQADENFRMWQAQFDPAAFQRDTFLAQQGLNQQGANSRLGAYQTDLDAFFTNRGLDLQGELGRAGIDIDRQRLGSQERMFGQSMDLDWARLLNDMQMGRYGLGLNYAQLQQAAQNRMFDTIFG